MTVYHMDVLLQKVLVYELSTFFGLTLLCPKCLSNYTLSASATALRQAPITYYISTNSTKQGVVAVEALDELTLQRETIHHFADGETIYPLSRNLPQSFFSIQRFQGRKGWGDQKTCLETSLEHASSWLLFHRPWGLPLDYESGGSVELPQPICHPHM